MKNGLQNDLILLDSITDLDGSGQGAIVVSGSHGGLYPAAVASRGGVRGVIFNDAGRGFEDAGIAGVQALAGVGMAAAANDCMSAEIGSANDSLDNGVISYANVIAANLGVRAGMTVRRATALMGAAVQPFQTLPPVPEARWDETPDGWRRPVLCVDSASLVEPRDAGRIIITGSHGGLIGGNPARALKARAGFAVFNDAGWGRNDIGVSRLPALQEMGVAAVTVDCQSCRIGDAASALRTGIISAANQIAMGQGARAGLALGALIGTLTG